MSEDKPLRPEREAIGMRLAEERVAHKLNQDQLASAVGKTRRSVAAWEAGDAMPDADALAGADRVGIDVLYVITGRRGSRLTERQSLLMDITTGMPDKPLTAVLVVAEALGQQAVQRQDTSAPSGGAQMTFNAAVTQAVGRDLQAQHNVLHPAENLPSRPEKASRK
jgi:transcriptional regulator with XRE-family HTH domain